MTLGECRPEERTPSMHRRLVGISAMIRILMLLDDIEDLLVDSSISSMLKEGGHQDERRMEMGAELYGEGVRSM
jgi:hypothetical protein